MKTEIIVKKTITEFFLIMVTGLGFSIIIHHKKQPRPKVGM